MEPANTSAGVPTEASPEAEVLAAKVGQAILLHVSELYPHVVYYPTRVALQ